MSIKRLLFLAVCIFSAGVIFGGQAFAEKVTFKLAGQYAPDHTTTILINEFAKMVNERTNGDVTIKVYPANQLGDYTQVYEELRRGTIDLAVITIPSQFDTRLEAIYLHYLAMNYDEARKVYGAGSKMFNLIAKVNAELGVKFLGFNVEGLGGLGTVKMPDNLDKPDGRKNILLRVPPMAVFQIPMDDEGFQTVSIPYAELYTALQTGVADGWSGGPAMVNYIEFRDVIKYFIASNNYFENTSYVMSMKSWNKLTPEQQKIVQDAALEISNKSFDISEAAEAGYLDKMEEAGIKVVRFSDEQLKAYAELCRKVSWPKMEERLGKEVIDDLLAEYK